MHAYLKGRIEPRLKVDATTHFKIHTLSWPIYIQRLKRAVDVGRLLYYRHIHTKILHSKC